MHKVRRKMRRRRALMLGLFCGFGLVSAATGQAVAAGFWLLLAALLYIACLFVSARSGF